jgi:FAD/FMN-containing dehydrogenase
LLTPLCIAKPSSSEDVASIIETITNQGYCPFAIKSQGHAPAAGFANIEHGLTIDLTELNAITTNEDASVARIGAGASWLDVYTHLDALNKTVAGGRNGGVGVGGLTLGGGISYFSPQAGFTCDSAINFELVLASGKLVNANATSRPDLFRALKGGLSNFGVVRYPTIRSRYVLDIDTSYLTPLL